MPAAPAHPAANNASLPQGAAARGLHGRLRRWFWARMPQRDSHHMVQRNLYILPTGAGWLLLATLLALLVASINYQLNLGYLLTFLVAGCAVVSVPMTHNTLRGLQLHLRPPQPQFAGRPVLLDVQLHNPQRRWRHGIGLLALPTDGDWMRPGLEAQQRVWVDCAPGSHCTAQLAWHGAERGWHDLPLIHVETRFPLGIFRVWSVWRPASQVLVYPTPEPNAPPAPPQAGLARDDAPPARAALTLPDELPEDVRPYQRGDSPRHIVWKKVAQTGALISRESRRPEAGTQWLDFADADPQRGTEPALQRLCAWVLEAAEGGQRFGLRLPNQLTLPPDQGAQHQQRCLQALAEYGRPRRATMPEQAA